MEEDLTLYGEADLEGTAGDETEGSDLEGTSGDGTEGSGLEGIEDGEEGSGLEGMDVESGESEGDAGDGLLDGVGMGEDYLYGDYSGSNMGGDMETSTAKDPILSSIPFVASTISVALVVGIILGVLLGRKRIKKGFDIYEN